MDIMVRSIARNTVGTYYEMTCGKTSMLVVVYDRGVFSGQVGTTVQNASHAAFRRMGRTFQSWDDALAAYKSGEAKAMISHARGCETTRAATSTEGHAA